MSLVMDEIALILGGSGTLTEWVTYRLLWQSVHLFFDQWLHGSDMPSPMSRPFRCLPIYAVALMTLLANHKPAVTCFLGIDQSARGGDIS
jgi:hypothetical protein